MLFYTIIFLAIFTLTLAEEKYSPKKAKWRIMAIMFSILAFVSGFRYLGGTDLELYETAYNKIPTIFSGDFFTVFFNPDYYLWEPGYLIYNSLFKTTLHVSFFGYLLLNAIVFYVFLYKGNKKYATHWGILLMFFMYKLFFYETFVAMRQSLSIAFFWIIMHYAEERKPVHYFLLWLLLVFSTHNGGAILFLVYFLNYVKITKKRFFMIGIVMIPFIFFSSVLNSLIGGFMALLSEDKAGYASSGETQSIFYTLEYYLVWYLIYINYDKIVKTNSHVHFIIKLFLVMLPCVTIMRDIVILRRLMDYFYLSVPILLGYLCDARPKYKHLIILCLTLVCFYGYTRYLTNFDGGSLMPYKSWLELPEATFFLK